MATVKELKNITNVLKITNSPLRIIEIVWDSSDPMPDLSKCINLTTFEISSDEFNHPLPDLSKCLKLEQFEISSDEFNHPLPDLSKCLKLERFKISSAEFNHPLPDLSKCLKLERFEIYSDEFNHPLPDLSKCYELKYFEFYCISSQGVMCLFCEYIKLWGYRAMSETISQYKDPNHIYNIARYNDFIGRTLKDISDEYVSEYGLTEAIKKNNEEREEDERINKIHQSIKEREYENKIEQLENKLEETREKLGNKIEKLEQNITDLFKIIEELKHPKSFYM